MSNSQTLSRHPNRGGPSPETLAITRQQVRNLLLQSEAFRALPLEKQRDIARHTVEIAAYLAEPEGMKGNTLPNARAQSDPYAVGLADDDNNNNNNNQPLPGTRQRQPDTRRQNDPNAFTAQAAREGAEVAGLLMDNVDFVNFVAGLIQGVFHSIVESSIDQMEAYSTLVANVAKSLNEFRDENVSTGQGRDHLVETFPDLFELKADTGGWDDFGSSFAEGDGESNGNGIASNGNGGGPRVQVKDGVDERAALTRVNNQLPLDSPVSNLDPETIENVLVQAARTHLATGRQQLLATMVTMGISRIVVTDGRISAKVMYDFQARDTFRSRTATTTFDYGDQYRYSSEGEYERERQGGETTTEGESSTRRDASYYSQGKYKYAAEPVVKLMSATQSASDAVLQTRASLAGSVDINFKSDYIPLDKIADNMQIGMLQAAARPGRRGPGRGVPPEGSQGQSPAGNTTT